MNNQVIKILESARREVIKAKELERKETENIYELADDLARKATDNGVVFAREIFKEIIKKYITDPLAIGNCKSKRENYKISYEVKVDGPRPTHKIESQNDRLARINNASKRSKDYIYFVRYQKPNKNKDLPIKLNINKINDYHIFDEFIRLYGEEGTYSFKASILINTLEELASMAYNNKLVVDNYLYSADVIELLKTAYIHIENIKTRMTIFLMEATANADKIYIDIYNKLANEYINNPNDGPYSALIESEIMDDANSKHQAMIDFFKESSMIGKSEEIRYLKHEETEDEYEYIPVYLTTLLNKLNEEDDKKIGYFQMVDWNNSLEFIFFGDKIRAYMQNIEVTNPKLKKRDK